MKKIILSAALALATLNFAFGQFSSDNVVVYRYGDGSTVANGAKVPVFIDEYNPKTGQLVRTITVPRTSVGSNIGMEGLGLTGAGAYETEGFPALSRDGEVLSLIGRHPTQTNQFVIATVNSAGAINANTLVTDDIGAPRSAVVEGTSVYYNGYQNGVFYKILGTLTAGTRVSAGQAAPRVLSIAETVYNGVESVRIFAPIGGSSQPVLASASPLPTSSVTFATTPNFPSTARPFNVHQAIAFRAYGRTIVYLIDDGDATGSAPVIRKYRSNAGGTDWLSLGSITVPATTKNLAAKFDGTGVRLYFTTLGTPGTQNSRLYSVTDIFNDDNDDTKQLTETPVLIATAPANTSFRGVTMTPGYRKAPSTLTANVISLTQVRLNWLDNSTTESGFQIERSTDGTNYSLLTTTAQNVVTYIDNTITAGNTYYYRVRGVEGSTFTIYTNPASAELGAGMVTDMSLAAQQVYENRPAGTLVGTLTVQPTTTTGVTYTLVAGNGSADNAKFRIVGNALQNDVLLDYEAQQTYQIRIRATSATSFIFEKTFTVSILDVNEAPTINTIGNTGACAGTEERIIALTGITAGPEAGQTLTATITSDQLTMFQSLQVNLTGAGNGEIRYRLNANASGEANIALTLKDNGGTANGGVDSFVENFKLTVYAFPIVTITSDRGNSVDKGVAVRLTATGGTSYQWEANGSIVGATNTASITVRPTTNTTYKVTVANAGGCTSIAEFTLSVADNYEIVTAANLVSPNGDGINDYWIIKNIDMYPESIVKVFDKTGRIIFTKKGYQNDWDGRVSGSSLKEDSYYYIIDFGAGLPKKKGSLTMINN
ncbi:gliding motility-associated C-terminal domain-containing protein [Nubsella zeaxanthinifaciens]|uniref:T9SS type B sorting domain-containing protein n=1 Tax=Nubsella zeaxanthinifaciens TaxID=392412 RepID=UPI000DE25A26|nr:gliding motility-associated C-terminal domain-containing protein [Nubsella zeaxanthinifaciens]